jgi:hypothetical protein
VAPARRPNTRDMKPRSFMSTIAEFSIFHIPAAAGFIVGFVLDTLHFVFAISNKLHRVYEIPKDCGIWGVPRKISSAAVTHWLH